MEDLRVGVASDSAVSGQHSCKQVAPHLAFAVPIPCVVTTSLFRRDSAQCRWSPEVE